MATEPCTLNSVTNRSRRPGEFGFAIVLLVFAVAALWQAYDISGFDKLSSPGVFPMLASAVMLVSALAIVREVQARPNPPASPSSSARPRLVRMTAMLFAYALLVPPLGFLAASGLFLFISLLWLWHRPWWAVLGITLASLLVVHLLFRQLFQVVLPQGSFDRWLAGLF